MNTNNSLDVKNNEQNVNPNTINYISYRLESDYKFNGIYIYVECR